MNHCHLIGPHALKAALHDGKEIALLDVRETGQFGERHLFYAKPLPYSRLELDIGRLVPRLSTRIVIVDDDETVAVRASAALAALGYRDLAVLQGGIGAWERAGLSVFAGVNVVSKTFGELVEHHLGTPALSAAQLQDMRERGRKVVVVDGRPYEEYRQMSIPGAVCCPNGELGLRIRAMVPDDDAVVVVNCAGRTRSIIGAQTLIELGLPNPVYALENGTQGWRLSGLTLEHGAGRRYPDNRALQPEALADARRRAGRFAGRAGVEHIDAATLSAWLDDPDRTTYVFDVRTAEEHAGLRMAGVRHAPGGQLLQATDHYIGVQHARVVLLDHDGIRAPIVAAWLHRMGMSVALLAVQEGRTLPGRAQAPLPQAALPCLQAAQAWRRIQAGELTPVDLRSSMAYRAAHIPLAVWAIRPRIRQQMAARAAHNLLWITDEPGLAVLAARELGESAVAASFLLSGGMSAWRDACLPIESSPGDPPDDACIDYLFFVHDRHHGNLEAARQYLAWETNLVRQLDQAELAGYRIAH